MHRHWLHYPILYILSSHTIPYTLYLPYYPLYLIPYISHTIHYTLYLQYRYIAVDNIIPDIMMPPKGEVEREGEGEREGLWARGTSEYMFLCILEYIQLLHIHHTSYMYIIVHWVCCVYVLLDKMDRYSWDVYDKIEKVVPFNFYLPTYLPTYLSTFHFIPFAFLLMMPATSPIWLYHIRAIKKDAIQRE